MSERFPGGFTTAFVPFTRSGLSGPPPQIGSPGARLRAVASVRAVRSPTSNHLLEQSSISLVLVGSLGQSRRDTGKAIAYVVLTAILLCKNCPQGE
jgi:hypothetical protein